MTTPKAIFYGLMMIAIAILLQPVAYDTAKWSAQADVAGMDSYDLESDWDFKEAVESIVEDCNISGFVYDEYASSLNILC